MNKKFVYEVGNNKKVMNIVFGIMVDMHVLLC